MLRLPPQKTKPCNNHAAITMHLAAPPIHIHADITMRFASTRCRTARENRFDPRNDRSRTRRTEENPFIAGCSHFTRKNKVCAPASSPKNKAMQQSCSYYNAFGSTTYTSMQPLSHYIAICTHALQNTKGEPIRPRNDRSRTRRTEENPFIDGCSHLTRKNTRFRAPASSPKQIKAHAKIMQLLQCVWQHHLHIHADITMRFASTRCRTARENQFDPQNDRSRTRRTQEVPFIAGCSHLTRKNTRFRAPASSPKTHPMQHECGHYNAFCSTTYIHADITMRFASTRCRTPREIRFDPENPRNDRRRTCRTAEENPHCRLQPLCTEKHNVSCSGFLPKTKPMQQSCSYYNAFGSTTYTSMQPLQCDLHPHVAKHQGRTDSTPKQPQPHPPHRGETFHRRLQPLDTEKHKVSCSGFLPKTHPMQHECGQYNAVCIIACLTRMSQQTWQQNMTAITQPTSQVSTSLRHHFPRHHFPRSPLPFVTTSLGTSFLGRHFPWSPLP